MSDNNDSSPDSKDELKDSIEKKDKKLLEDGKKKEKKEKLDEAEVEEIISEMPPEVRRTFKMAMMQSSSLGRFSHPIFDKFNEKHIDKFLDYTQKDDDNLYKLKSSNRWFYLLYTLLGLGFFIFLITFLLPIDREIFIEILKLTVAFAGGVGSGYGIKSLIDKKNN
ncbi:MAG: hypothetical protein RBT49_09300 [Bacteroidales bacterium]|jgi:hypothetical protein|nr:hypothetical protein [Bacteroidales bacterium]